ncbi:folylpolyglutamate synthase [Pichia californica]|uniref:Folylpolyglutamate synthase n=1 Tax=Pichia californica TaxID=460514 RepID=A0A9P6WMG1_9ASCO|nr:folylpolyglutamate synthase [[Candida] californica]KAG0689844.1 folylpolyglutamate synthase [[Candida] californica]
MPLDLQLHRIQKLLTVLGNPHYKPQFIHVAGTNGKGSVCSYISHILSASGISNGRFNSPHLITPRDSIQIDNMPVSLKLYEKCKKYIIDTDIKYNIGCTEFELLTCTAFQIFAESQVSIAVLEVGVGGRLDATNVVPAERTIVVGITKVGLDHQNLLGKTLSEIAYQKVGIFKRNVPAVIDGSNEKDTIEVAEKEAEEISCTLNIAKREEDFSIKSKLLGDYQYDNLAVALKMVSLIKSEKITKETMKNGVESTVWPGRLQNYKLKLPEFKDKVEILLDGAHNTQASIELGKYLNTLRTENNFIFIIAITEGKNLASLFNPIITSKDIIIFTQFNDNIEGMPWIRPSNVDLLKDEVKSQSIPHKEIYTIRNCRDAVLKAYELSKIMPNTKIVVCGSLYLVADILRI